MAANRKNNFGTFGLFLRLIVAGSCFAVIFLLWSAALKYRDYQAHQSAYDNLILAAAKRNGVDPALVKAVIWRESRFRPLARGNAGEIGLMQIMPGKAATDWAVFFQHPVPNRGALSSPDLNIEIGSWYLANALRRWREYKDRTRLALCEYNAGFTRANAWKPLDKQGNVMPRITISSTYSYVNSVMDRYREYKKDGFRNGINEQKEKK